MRFCLCLSVTPFFAGIAEPFPMGLPEPFCKAIHGESLARIFNGHAADDNFIRGFSLPRLYAVFQTGMLPEPGLAGQRSSSFRREASVSPRPALARAVGLARRMRRAAS